ncbi:hypothetical protein [Halorussus salinus]|uniref:hypothetical protein n=1 Tax=Halorussus salinus TaxID=1364935 RepID=UPI001EE4DC45|nr:hypothetical protein [Halorussus salinus]
MSDERDDRDGSERDDRARPPERGDRDPDEPLGDLAEEVRQRTGRRSRRDEASPGRDGERPDGRDGRDRSEREGPLADVAAAVDERRTRKRDDADAFESVEVGEVDGERLWEELAAGGEGETASAPADRSGDAAVSSGSTSDPSTDAANATAAGATTADATNATAAESAATDSPADWVADEADRAADPAGRDVRTIPKTTCHGCPHFGEPPELACTHEGTDILAMVDSDHFRVADCPMVVDGEEDIGTITDTDGESDDS